MSETTTIHVSNISPNTTKSQLNDFFTFCGKIKSITLTPASAEPSSTQKGTVTFERTSAAKTALLLDQTSLDGRQLHVEPAHTIDEIAAGKTAGGDAEEPSFGAEGGNGGVSQEDKPRAAVLAEYLSAGYAVGDTALQKAIEYDQKAGLTTKFTNILHNLDVKLHATETAKNVDSTYHVTDKLKEGQSILTRYFERALETPTGRKVRQFYAQGAKQVVDIHNEARRLAEEKKKNAEAGVFIQGDKSTCGCGGDEAACKCPPEKCACVGCHKQTKAKEEGKGYPTAGTAEGGEAKRQFEEVKQDVVGTVKDMTQ